jgi:hypothetical protein
MTIITTPLLRGGAIGCVVAGGVLVDMPDNTPLHPSQEGNRTAYALFSSFFN